MPANVTVPTRELIRCFDELSYLLPKGVKELPVGVELSSDKLEFFYATGCLYYTTIPVKCNDIASCTIIYYPLAELLRSTGSEEVTITFYENRLTFEDGVVSFGFKKGSSIVEKPDMDLSGMTSIDSDIWIANIKGMLGMSLDQLYQKEEAITIADQVATIKYPNTWVRVRAPGISLNRTIDTNHMKTLCRFVPTTYKVLGIDAILFSRKNSYLMLPCKVPNDIESTQEFLSSTLGRLKEPCTVSVGGYAESLRAMSKLTTLPYCSLRFYEKGMITEINESGASMSLTCGVLSEKPLGHAQLPCKTWLTFLKALGSEIIQVLIGGDLICLRNQSMIILTSARG